MIHHTTLYGKGNHNLLHFLTNKILNIYFKKLSQPTHDGIQLNLVWLI